ncbi:hypothetical protein [Nocardia sp. NPDC049707]|uniref:hypothetical protein n=1 Tax=Nocardia sp. NPDC049707 TaxID=3154735 RepID=UPI003436B6CD
MTSIDQHTPVPHPAIDAHADGFFSCQLATIVLTEMQALTLCDIFEGSVAYANESWLLEPGRRMAEEVRARAQEDPHHGERWGVHFAALAELCESWHPAQAFAVLNAIDRYWISDVDDALSAVGLVRGPARQHNPDPAAAAGSGYRPTRLSGVLRPAAGHRAPGVASGAGGRINTDAV